MSNVLEDLDRVLAYLVPGGILDQREVVPARVVDIGVVEVRDVPGMLIWSLPIIEHGQKTF